MKPWLLITGMLLLQGKSFLFHPRRASRGDRRRWSLSLMLLVGKQEESSEQRRIHSSLQVPQFHGETVANVMEESIKLLNKWNCPEPVESTVHLLASSLGLSWESGYRELLHQAS